MTTTAATADRAETQARLLEESGHYRTAAEAYAIAQREWAEVRHRHGQSLREIDVHEVDDYREALGDWVRQGDAIQARVIACIEARHRTGATP